MGNLVYNPLTKEQIIGLLKQDEAGAKTPDPCRQMSIMPQTYFRWKTTYGGMKVSDAKRLLKLEAENRQLKQFLRGVQLHKAV